LGDLFASSPLLVQEAVGMAMTQKKVCKDTYEAVQHLQACAIFGEGWKRGPQNHEDGPTDHWCCGDCEVVVRRKMEYALHCVLNKVDACANMQLLHHRVFQVKHTEFFVGWVRLYPFTPEEPHFQEAFDSLHARRPRRPVSDSR